MIIGSDTESIQKVSSHRCLQPTNDSYDRRLLSTVHTRASVPAAIVDYKIINDPNFYSYPAMHDIALTYLPIILLSQIQNEIDGKEQDMLSYCCYAIVLLTDPSVISTKSMPSLVL